MRRRQPVVSRQGHWHVEYIRPLARSRRAIAWEIATEEKRPSVVGYSWWSEDDDRWLRIDIEPREGSLGFRDGQDGSEWTEVMIPIPPERWWAKWWREHGWRRYRTTPHWTVVSENDKWCVYVVALRLA